MPISAREFRAAGPFLPLHPSLIENPNRNNEDNRVSQE